MINRSKIQDSVDIRRSGVRVLDWGEMPAPLRADMRVTAESITPISERLIIDLRLGAQVTVTSCPLPEAVEDVCDMMHNYLYGEVLTRLSHITHMAKFSTREQVLAELDSLTRRIQD